MAMLTERSMFLSSALRHAYAPGVLMTGSADAAVSNHSAADNRDDALGQLRLPIPVPAGIPLERF
jgi:hypothetical protein